MARWWVRGGQNLTFTSAEFLRESAVGNTASEVALQYLLREAATYPRSVRFRTPPGTLRSVALAACMETRSLDDLDSLLNALGSLVALSLAIYLAGYVKHLLHDIVRGLEAPFASSANGASFASPSQDKLTTNSATGATAGSPSSVRWSPPNVLPPPQWQWRGGSEEQRISNAEIFDLTWEKMAREAIHKMACCLPQPPRDAKLQEVQEMFAMPSGSGESNGSIHLLLSPPPMSSSSPSPFGMPPCASRNGVTEEEAREMHALMQSAPGVAAGAVPHDGLLLLGLARGVLESSKEGVTSRIDEVRARDAKGFLSILQWRGLVGTDAILAAGLPPQIQSLQIQSFEHGRTQGGLPVYVEDCGMYPARLREAKRLGIPPDSYAQTRVYWSEECMRRTNLSHARGIGNGQYVLVMDMRGLEVGIMEFNSLWPFILAAVLTVAMSCARLGIESNLDSAVSPCRM